jgi:hypothetical protein
MASVDRKLGFLLLPLPSCPLFLLLSSEKFSPCSVFQTLSTLSRSVSLVCSCVFSVSITPCSFFPFLYPLCFPPGFFVSLSSLVLTRSSVSLRRNRGVTVLQFWFVLLGCSLVLSVCLFPGLSSLSNGFFFRVFSSGFSACSSSVSWVFFPVSPTWVFFFFRRSQFFPFFAPLDFFRPRFLRCSSVYIEFGGW